jgi:hypothetical protein
MSKKLFEKREESSDQYRVETEQVAEKPEQLPALEDENARLDTQAAILQLLLDNSLEFQQIIALYRGVMKGDKSSFSHIRRNTLNIIDSHFDLYRKRFSIPDRAVELSILCEDGKTYYLSLNNGYLCFYEHPEQKKRVPYWPIKRSSVDKTRLN